MSLGPRVAPTAGRPFVDRPVVDAAAADAALAEVVTAWGMPPARLLRRGMNSLYRCGDMVMRVGVATAPAVASHELANALLDAGIPTVPPVDGLAADRNGFAVTGWRFVESTGQPVDWRRVGAIVRRVHELAASALPSAYPLADPSQFPWWQFETMLADVVDLVDDGAMAGLRTTIERHRDWVGAVGRDAVVCHGDVHPGNVLMSADGPLLVDWDLLCAANPAWDHAMLTVYAPRWGGDPTAYDSFAAGYGRSFADDPLTMSLGALRNVAATLLRLRAGRADVAAAAEANRRLAYWRGESDEPWSAQ